MKSLIIYFFTFHLVQGSFAKKEMLGHYSYILEQAGGESKSSSKFTYNLWFSQEDVWIEKEPAIANFSSIASSFVSNGITIDTNQLRNTIPAGIVMADYFQYNLNTKIHKFIRWHSKQQQQDNFVVVDTLPDINWILTDEYKKIDSFNCQKAIGNFRGRTYYAWYTKEIPVSAGPWKLHGLPGLILEAVDSLNEIKFYLQSLSIPPVKDPKTIDFVNYKQYSRDEYGASQKKSADALKLFIKSTNNGDEAIRLLEEQQKKTKPRPIELF